MSALLALPYDIIVRIALDVATIDDLGPPSHLPPLLSSCSAINNQLSHAHHLYAAIFKAKFDCSASKRRIGLNALHNKSLAFQLKKNCSAITRLRRCQYADDDDDLLQNDLLTAFLLMTENDGRNLRQLVDYAHLDLLVDRIVRCRLNDSLHNGWPVESVLNNLAVWLLWMTTDIATLRRESVEQREELISLLFPFVIASFRYPSFHAPDIHFSLPLNKDTQQHNTITLPHSVVSQHGPYPKYLSDRRSPCPLPLLETIHYTHPLTLLFPPISHAAQLLYFSRREVTTGGGFGIPDRLPATRADALRLNDNHIDWRIGPTREDYLEFNSWPGARLPNKGTWFDEGSESSSSIDSGRPKNQLISMGWDADWERWTNAYDPFFQNPRVRPPTLHGRYAHGSIVGKWSGRMLIPNEHTYTSLIQQSAKPPELNESFPRSFLRPLLLTIREHVCLWPAAPIGGRGEKERREEVMRRDRVVRQHKLKKKKRRNPSSTVEINSANAPNEIFDEGVRNAYLPDLISDREEDSMFYQDNEDRTYVYDDYEAVRNIFEEEGVGVVCHLGPSGSKPPKKCKTCSRSLWCPRKDPRKEIEEEEERERQREREEEGRSPVDSGYCDMDMDTDTEMDADESSYTDIEAEMDTCADTEMEMNLNDAYHSSNSSNYKNSYPSHHSQNAQDTMIDSDSEDSDDEEDSFDYRCVCQCRCWTGSSNGVMDVTFSGDTEKRHGDAWCNYKYYGRLRSWDGLIVLVGEPIDRDPQKWGRWIFRGYLHGGQNFTGKWRHVAYGDVFSPPWEGPFTLSRRE